jgi:hypothetical protein
MRRFQSQTREGGLQTLYLRNSHHEVPGDLGGAVELIFEITDPELSESVLKTLPLERVKMVNVRLCGPATDLLVKRSFPECTDLRCVVAPDLSPMAATGTVFHPEDWPCVARVDVEVEGRTDGREDETLFKCFSLLNKVEVLSVYCGSKCLFRDLDFQGSRHVLQSINITTERLEDLRFLETMTALRTLSLDVCQWGALPIRLAVTNLEFLRVPSALLPLFASKLFGGVDFLVIAGGAVDTDSVPTASTVVMEASFRCGNLAVTCDAFSRLENLCRSSVVYVTKGVAFYVYSRNGRETVAFDGTALNGDASALGRLPEKMRRSGFFREIEPGEYGQLVLRAMKCHGKVQSRSLFHLTVGE